MVAFAVGVDRYSFYNRVRTWIPIGLVAPSFFIYGGAALIVSKNQQNDFIPERSSIAAAVSNVAYRAPLGKVYSAVLEQFLDFKIPMYKTLAQAEREEIPRKALLGSTSDGNGIGYIVVASLGMRLFGLHSSSLLLSMLALMGISALAFLWRFRDKRLCSQHDDRRYPIFFVGCDIASIPSLAGVRRRARTWFPNDQRDICGDGNASRGLRAGDSCA